MVDGKWSIPDCRLRNAKRQIPNPKSGSPAGTPPWRGEILCARGGAEAPRAEARVWVSILAQPLKRSRSRPKIAIERRQEFLFLRVGPWTVFTGAAGFPWHVMQLSLSEARPTCEAVVVNARP